MEAVNRTKVEKRNRPPVSCEPCRTRKLRCNRELPCDSCQKRSKAAQCFYATNAQRNKPGSTKAAPAVRDRLNALEALVSSVLSGKTVVRNGDGPDLNERPTANAVSHSNGSASSTPGSQGTVLTPETPHLHESQGGQVNYADAGHWKSILEDIKEVRDHISTLDSPHTNASSDSSAIAPSPDASLVFNMYPQAGLAEILEGLPSQSTCDMLVSSYFQFQYPISGVVHPAKFQVEYEEFWRSPMNAPPLWVGLLFSVLTLAVSFRQASGRTNGLDNLMPSTTLLREKVIQCLVLGQFSTANAHALEALLLRLQSFFVNNDYYSINLWFEMGAMIRLAFRMGYHRDPSNFTRISPFEGEMRRRVWVNIVQIDAIISFQEGFPSMIVWEFCDTQRPSNLDCSDIWPGMEALPPGRPLTEKTSVRYSIVKSSIMAVFKKIAAHTQSLIPPKYERTMELDAELRSAFNGLPDDFKPRPVNRSFMDPVAMIMLRCTIEILYLKSTVVLHRRYIRYEQPNPQFEPSRQACVGAALDILARQADLHKEILPGGRLCDDGWMILRMPINDFLLASMVICFDLSVSLRYNTQDSADQQLTKREYEALQVCRDIWARNGRSGAEKQMAALALDLMLKKVDEASNQNPGFPSTHGPELFPFTEVALPYANSMSQMIDGTEDIDWGLLDQYFQHVDLPGADF